MYDFVLAAMSQLEEHPGVVNRVARRQHALLAVLERLHPVTEAAVAQRQLLDARRLLHRDRTERLHHTPDRPEQADERLSLIHI